MKIGRLAEQSHFIAHQGYTPWIRGRLIRAILKHGAIADSKRNRPGIQRMQIHQWNVPSAKVQSDDDFGKAKPDRAPRFVIGLDMGSSSPSHQRSSQHHGDAPCLTATPLS